MASAWLCIVWENPVVSKVNMHKCGNKHTGCKEKKTLVSTLSMM